MSQSSKKGGLAKKLSDVGSHAFSLAYLSKSERKPELLLAPNIPKPLHEVCPRNVLGVNWWNKERRKCYESTLFRCLACGVPKYCAAYHQWLEGHETYKIDYQRGRAVYTGSVPLCHLCHNSIHDGRLEALLAQGKIHHAKYVAVIQHRDKVLAEAGLKKLPLQERVKQLAGMSLAPWSQWRMVIDDKEYPPKFTSFEDWKLHHGESSVGYALEFLSDEMEG